MSPAVSTEHDKEKELVQPQELAWTLSSSSSFSKENTSLTSDFKDEFCLLLNFFERSHVLYSLLCLASFSQQHVLSYLSPLLCGAAAISFLTDV